jgi:hypothetical protein
MGWESYESRREFLLKMLKKDTDQLLKVDQYEKWQKSNKPKNSYSYKPKRVMRTKDIYNKECLNSYYQPR